MEHVQIGAKTLGELAVQPFCLRCFWLSMDRKGRLPFNKFPSIFSRLDQFTKNAVHNYFDKYKEPPPYLSELGKIVGYQDPPKSSWFRYYDKEADVTLTGEPDAIFDRDDGSIVIADYKTAILKNDPLLCIYQVQLACYAFLAEHHGMGPVTGTYLLYAEPLSGADDVAAADFTHQQDGIALGYRIKTLPVKMPWDGIPPLLKALRDIMNLESCPSGEPGCWNCVKTDEFIERAVVKK